MKATYPRNWLYRQAGWRPGQLNERVGLSIDAMSIQIGEY